MATPATQTEQTTSALPAKWNDRATFSVEEFAEIFGLSRTSAYVATNNGTVGTVRIGRRLIIPRAAIERLLAA
jgi:excisionase family DNA binding protein